jgi:GT2 family glycosyltransferase
MADVSVIIVSWNAREFLRNCLNSIQEVGRSTVREIIVVDNASIDGSAEMVADQFPEVLLIRSAENLGFARANNLGIKRSSGSWLALVNSDVIVHANCFPKLVDFLSSHEKVGLVGPKIFGGDGRLQPSCRRLPTLWNTTCQTFALPSIFPRSNLFSGRQLPLSTYESAQEVEVLSGCFWMARRSAVDQVGGLDERFFFYAEDVDWCKRFWDNGWKIMLVPEATATHFGGGSSANAPLRYSIEMIRANLLYWRKHRGVVGWIGFYWLSLVHHCLRLLARFPQKVFADEDIRNAEKFHRSRACLAWLLTGKSFNSF